MNEQHNEWLTVCHRCAGRAVHVRRDGTLYVCRGYNIYSSEDDGRSWSSVMRMPVSINRRLGQVSRLAGRLLRLEVRALATLSDGTHVAANREWVFHGRAGDGVMSRATVEERGQPLAPPMTLTVGPEERVLWGEYNSRTGHNLPVRLYVSDDGGRSYQIARVFTPGEILHIHNLIYDHRHRHYWLMAGDHDEEPGIGRLSVDLEDFEWIRKGKQCYRAVEVFDFDDRLLYATDTHLEPNALISMDKATGRIEQLMQLGGSCIYACRFGGIYALTTTVEPSTVNTSQHAELWLSRDGDCWRKAFRAEKDRWNAFYFQFGSLVLPRGRSDREVILFSGQALRGIDGQAMTARLVEEGTH